MSADSTRDINPRLNIFRYSPTETTITDHLEVSDDD